uniref:Tumor susceptibility 101b n=1 Tax=Astyanax mexicanus TaxID=7994 RepID=A0A8B9HQZ0_ASTMX
MMIKTGKHVDANGKIYLPYLHEWKHPQSDLFGLIQVMIVVFGEEPPVFSRPTTQTPYQAFPASGPPTCTYKQPADLHKARASCFCAAGPARDGTIGEDTIRASLVSAVSDKLRWRMKEEMDRAQAELDALKRTEEDLKKGHQKLEEMVTKLDQEIVRTTITKQIFNFYFVDHVRLLSCKQFQLRALMQKARKTAGLSDLY